jgi:hypothetical protein
MQAFLEISGGRAGRRGGSGGWGGAGAGACVCARGAGAAPFVECGCVPWGWTVRACGLMACVRRWVGGWVGWWGGGVGGCAQGRGCARARVRLQWRRAGFLGSTGCAHWRGRGGAPGVGRSRKSREGASPLPPTTVPPPPWTPPTRVRLHGRPGAMRPATRASAPHRRPPHLHPHPSTPIPPPPPLHPDCKLRAAGWRATLMHRILGHPTTTAGPGQQEGARPSAAQP